jgi:hypothetical protein
MQIGISVHDPAQATRVAQKFHDRFEASGHNAPASHRALHAHGLFGRGPAASPAVTALHTALLVLALEPSLQTVWVVDPLVLAGLDRGRFPFSIRAVGELPRDSKADAWLELDGTDSRTPRKFHELAAQWSRETAHLSSTTARLAHPAYQSIIALGQDALPLLIEQMKAGRGHWDAALRTITGENPVPVEHAGKFRLIATDWVHWAEKRGLLR